MTTRTIAIVGAGCSGTLVTAQLARAAADARTALSVLLIDATDHGPGLAYATEDPLHLLNVPAARLGAFDDLPDGFLAFARSLDSAIRPEDFVPRRWYGRYLRDVLDQADARLDTVGGALERIVGEVVAIEPVAGGECLTFDDGGTRRADLVVLASGVLPSQVDPPLDPTAPTCFASPWLPGALTPLDDATVLLVGSGLTAVDAALTLTAGSPNVRVVAVSRSGAWPFAHRDGPLHPPVPAPDTLEAAARRGADELAEAVCAHIASVDGRGEDWRDAVDGIRPHVQRLWGALAADQQSALLTRHVRAWERRRHRMAPAVAQRLAELERAGRVRLLRGTVGDALAQLRVDRVIACTGPAADITRVADPLLQQLFAVGRACTDEQRLGLRTDDGWLLDATGSTSTTLATLGPLRRGELWESTAVPEIRSQATRLADQLLQQTDSRR